MPIDLGRVTHLTDQMHRSEDDAGDPIAAGLLLAADGARGHTWTDPAVIAGATALDDLSDVTITSPATADRLRYNGSAWVNSALIWRPVMAFDGTNWYVVVAGDGTAVVAEG